MPADLNSWLLHLENLHPKAIDLGLERVSYMANKLGLSNINSFVITVTGTNGKGSCVALLEIILHSAGYKVGTYTSPHLLRYNERIKINGKEVTDQALCEAFAHIEEQRGDTTLTQFEFGTLAALLLFQQANLDILILEVGLGGRLDAVNVIDPDLAIISTIALDHTELLGNSREAIGREKAGLMRKGKPVVCGDFEPPATIKEHAEQVGAILYSLQEKKFGYKMGKGNWEWWSENLHLTDLPLPKVELQNAATVLKALELMPPSFSVSRSAIQSGLEKVFLPGRFQITAAPIQRIYDVAHNPASAVLLAKQLVANPAKGRSFAVIAMLNDKDQQGTVIPLLPLIDTWFVAGLPVPRGGSAHTLVQNLSFLEALHVLEHTSVANAYRMALQEAQEGDRIIVFGSFYTVAEVMQLEL